jgi:penicillin amidase
MRFGVAALFVLVFVAFARAQESRESLLAKARAVLSPLEGKLQFPGLKQPVEVLRDTWGVPHIYAKNADDLFFAQGLVVAQDRLFQIDWWRRVGAGETAEVLGPSALEADRFARLIRYRGDMQREWTSYAPDTEAIATAFTRGINAWIDHIGDRLPIEFQVLGHRPKHWRPEDILGRMSGFVMSGNLERELARARLVAAVGPDEAQRLAPTDPPIKYTLDPALEAADFTPAIIAGFKTASKSPAFKPSKSESNNWVVDGSLSASGKPMLASDPHRAIMIPSLRYVAHLHAPGWNVIGAGEPALPGLAVGHNEHIAWGITIVHTDLTDLFVEMTDPADNTRYKTETGWQAMDVVREKVTVRGQKEPTEIELRYTRHGPVIYQEKKRQRAYAIKWAGSEPGGAAYLASLSVGRATNKQEFLHALERWKIPGLNFVYANIDGQVGWVPAAATPVRKKGNGLVPVPGWTGEYGWERYLTVAELPQRFDPPQHWIATANHKILPPDYKREISYEWSAPFRYLRIEEVLAAAKKLDLGDFQRLQQDVVSIPGRRLGKLLTTIDGMPAELQPFAKILIGWDGNLTRDSKEGPLYAVWLQELRRQFYARKSAKLSETLRLLNQLEHLLHELEEPSPVWFGAEPKKERDRFVIATFTQAVKQTRMLAGDDPSAWRWGKIHVTPFRHSLDTLGGLYEQTFDHGPVERGGDGNSPNNTTHDDTFRQIHGASYRHVLDLADWDRGLATSTPGQSGQLGSPHYGDLLPLWAEGNYIPLSFSRGKVESVVRHRLTLTP